MKKRLPIILAAVFAVLAVVFLCLWQAERQNAFEESLRFAQNEAAAAQTCFEEYRDQGAERNYWFAVAEFRAFQQAFLAAAPEPGERAASWPYSSDTWSIVYITLSAVHADLTIHPERGQEHLDKIIEALSTAAADITDRNWELRMMELRNELEYD